MYVVRQVHPHDTVSGPTIPRRVVGFVLMTLSLVASGVSAQDTPPPVQRDRATPVLQTGAALGLGALGVGVAAGFAFGVLAMSGLEDADFRTSYIAGGVAATALVPLAAGAGATWVGRRRGGHGTYRAAVLGSLVGGIAATGLTLAVMLPLQMSGGGNPDDEVLLQACPIVGLAGATAGAVLGYQWSGRRAQEVARWVPLPAFSSAGAALAWSGNF